jgi:hypothetical protein
MSTRKKRAFEADASVAIAAMMARRLTGIALMLGGRDSMGNGRQHSLTPDGPRAPHRPLCSTAAAVRAPASAKTIVAS